MSKTHQRKMQLNQMIRGMAHRMLGLDNSTPQLIRQNAWKISEGKEDWQRRLIYGKLMTRFSSPTMKKDYAKKQKNQINEAIMDMKDGLI